MWVRIQAQVHLCLRLWPFAAPSKVEAAKVTTPTRFGPSTSTNSEGAGDPAAAVAVWRGMRFGEKSPGGKRLGSLELIRGLGNKRSLSLPPKDSFKNI